MIGRILTSGAVFVTVPLVCVCNYQNVFNGIFLNFFLSKLFSLADTEFPFGYAV